MADHAQIAALIERLDASAAHVHADAHDAKVMIKKLLTENLQLRADLERRDAAAADAAKATLAEP